MPEGPKQEQRPPVPALQLSHRSSTGMALCWAPGRCTEPVPRAAAQEQQQPSSRPPLMQEQRATSTSELIHRLFGGLAIVANVEGIYRKSSESECGEFLEEHTFFFLVSSS